jgi:excisionase family DNA binding protein
LRKPAVSTDAALVLLLPVAPAMDRTLFIDEAARVLGVSRRTVYYRIRDGRLLTIRTKCGSRRVLLSSIEALLREEEDRRSVRLQQDEKAIVT